ncbi:MAG: arylsulfatase [Acidobacteriota bacterium]
MRKSLLVATALAAIAAAVLLLLRPPSTDAAPARDAVLAIQADLRRSAPMDDEVLPSPDRPPNIVLVVADDLGWRDVGYHQSEIRTPTIDRLAGAGVTLGRFYAHPTCSPTRAALMTGRSPLRLGILNPLSKNNPTGLPLTETTVATRLRDNGYQTALIGKWHLGPRNLSYHPNARGFDHFYGNLTGGVGYYDKVHGGGYDWQRNGKTVRQEGYTTHLLAEEAVRWIRGRDPDRPLFLYAAFGAPHLPNEAPPQSIALYSKIEDERRRLHAAMVSELDEAIRRIHQTIVEEGLERETLIWFLSDNGGMVPKNPLRHLPEPFFTPALEMRFGVDASPMFADFARTNLRAGGSDNRPFRGGKQTVLEGGVRVPSFLSWPGVLGPARFDYMATVQDVTPTLLKIAGVVDDAQSFDGRSLWTALRIDRPAPPLEFIVREAAVTDSTAVYRYPFKLILRAGEPKQLYHLERDPLESENILREEPRVVDELTQFFQEFPKGPEVSLPLQTVVDDPDYFGGEEDRTPWAEQAYRE